MRTSSMEQAINNLHLIHLLILSRNMSELHYQSAKELARMIREKSVSVTEVMQAHLARIRATNSQVNAICTLLPEDELLAQAAEKDAQLAAGHAPGPLFGLSGLPVDDHGSNQGLVINIAG